MVAGWSVALIALACIGPPLFSHDLFGYAIYGRLLVFHHANPYVQTPSVAPHDPFYPYNPWTHFRSPYGPAFTDISAALVWVFRSAAATVAAFKALSGACWVATVLLAARLGRRWGPTRACFAAAVIGLNPVVIFRIVAGGHADALVALAIIAALTAWYEARPLLVTVFLTFAILVKIVAVIPFVIFLVASIRALPTTPDRMKNLAKHLAVVIGLSIVALLPFGYTPSVLSANLNQGTVSGGSLRPPEVMIAARADSLLRHVGLSHHVALSNRVDRGAVPGRGGARPPPPSTSRRDEACAGASASCSADLSSVLAVVRAVVPGLVHPGHRLRDPEDAHRGGRCTLAHCIGIARHTAHVRAGFAFACPAVLRRLSASCSRAAHRAPGRARPTPAT